MKLTLEGFRTYQAKTIISLPEKGCTLIEGPSGQGKSTLFRAIAWGLYGGKEKAYNWATTKKKCYVQIDLEEIKISILRQKNPERLSVTTPDNTVLENEEAQSWVLKQWGSKEAWIASSYMIQNVRSCWIYGTAADRLSLLEEWVFSDDPPSRSIELFQTEKKKAQQTYDKIYQEYQVLIKSLPPKPENLSFEWDDYSEENKQEYQTELKRLEEQWEQFLQKESHASLLQSLFSQVKELESEIDDVQQKMWPTEELQIYKETTEIWRKYHALGVQMKDMDKKIGSLWNEEMNYLMDYYHSLKEFKEALQHQTLVENQFKQCKELGYENQKQIQAKLLVLQEIENNHTKVQEFIRLSEMDNIQPIEDHEQEMFSEKEIKQVQVQETIYQQFIKQLTSLKLSPETWRDVQLMVQRSTNITPSALKAYQDFQSIQIDDSDDDQDKIMSIHQEIQEKTQSLHVMTCPHCNQFVQLKNKQLVVSESAPSTEQEIATLKKELQRLTFIQDQRTKKELLFSQWSSCCEDENEYEWLISIQKKLPPSKDHAKILFLTDVSHPTRSSEELLNHNLWKKRQDLEKELHSIVLTHKEYQQPISKVQKTIAELKHINSQWKEPLDFDTSQIHRGMQIFQWKIQRSELLTQRNQLFSASKDEEQDMDTRQQILSEQKELISKYHHITQQYKKLLEQKKKLELTIEAVQSMDIETIKEQRETIQQYLEECRNVLPWKHHEKERLTIEQQCSASSHLLQSWSQIIEKAKWLEHTLLEQHLTTINTILENVIGSVFVDPLNVHFGLFKGERPTVQLSMLYKGGQNEGLTELSGGEIDRLSLALTLASAVSSPFPYLLLDECFGSLDAEAREKCLDTIKLLLPHKSVYIIAHEQTQGEFNYTHSV